MKITRSQKETNRLFALILVALCIIMVASAQILMKYGMSRVSEINSLSELLTLKTMLSIVTNWHIMLGIILYAVSAVLWLGAMSTLNISYIYPMASFAYVITALLAFMFLKEDITLLRWVGIGVVVIGCFLVSRT